MVQNPLDKYRDTSKIFNKGVKVAVPHEILNNNNRNKKLMLVLVLCFIGLFILNSFLVKGKDHFKSDEVSANEGHEDNTEKLNRINEMEKIFETSSQITVKLFIYEYN